MLNTKIKILLIEDDIALGSLISELLCFNDFTVQWFKNGAEALEGIKKAIPDVIISDYMMPEMNGEEFFLAIKKNSLYQSIPFIMVTANMEEGLKYRQLKNGVNDFIMKPFQVKELVYKIRNVINLKLSIEKKMNPDPFSKVTIQLSERNFITTINTILSAHLKEQIDIDDICKKLFISRSTLDKKIRLHTNKNISRYIREFKLEYAIKLIDLGERNIQFIADETGFNSISYFSTSFKSYKEVTPTQYIKTIASDLNF
jgi:DNA-binding response OmpR family regulator